MSFICIIIKNHFHINGFALSLALKVRFFGTRKWPIILNGESQNVFFFCFLVFNFSFFQIILDGDGATSRSRNWKTSSQVSFLLPGNEVAHMEARLYTDPVNTSIQDGDKKKKVERAAKIVDTIYVVNPLNPKIKI